MNTASQAIGLEKKLKVYAPSEHGISFSGISDGASRVMNMLLSHGFDAYLVGGGVRDLLLKKKPTDFDIATNATPVQISKIFKRSRMIGRRFKLVHVRVKSEIVEVATFRRSPGSENDLTRQGMIRRDNDFGNIEEDVVRRDFTVNALYLDYSTMNVHDYVGGFRDLNDGILRLIGDPETRFSEDPVRVLRAVRFAESFDFKMTGFTKPQLQKFGGQLKHIPSARLFGEMNKLFLRGVAKRTFSSLRDLGLLHHLLPLTGVDFTSQKTSIGERFIEKSLINTDQRVIDGEAVTPAFLIAVFLWGPLVKEKKKQEKLLSNRLEAMIRAEEFVLKIQLERIAIPRRITKMVR